MLARLRERPIVTAIVVFFVLRIAGSFFVGPTTCRDGWHSPSIGRRGACSHYGGVGLNVGAVLATMVSGGVGLGVYVFLLPSPPASQTPTSRPSAPRPPTSKPPQPTPNRDKAPSSTAIQRGPPPYCPICGASMRRRTSRRGRRSRRGKEFFGCSRYPNCHGVRPIENQPSPGPLFTWADTASRKATDADLSRCRETTPERPPAKVSPNTSPAMAPRTGGGPQQGGNLRGADPAPHSERRGSVDGSQPSSGRAVTTPPNPTLGWRPSGIHAARDTPRAFAAASTRFRRSGGKLMIAASLLSSFAGALAPPRAMKLSISD